MNTQHINNEIYDSVMYYIKKLEQLSTDKPVLRLANLKEFCLQNTDEVIGSNCDIYLEFSNGMYRTIYSLHIENGSGTERLLLQSSEAKHNTIVTYNETYLDSLKYLSFKRLINLIIWMYSYGKLSTLESLPAYEDAIDMLDMNFDIMKQPIYSSLLKSYNREQLSQEEIEGIIQDTLCSPHVTNERLADVNYCYTRSHFDASRAMRVLFNSRNIPNVTSELVRELSTGEIQSTTEFSNKPARGNIGYKKVQLYQSENESRTRNYYTNRYNRMLLEYADMLLMELSTKN